MKVGHSNEEFEREVQYSEEQNRSLVGVVSGGAGDVVMCPERRSE